MALSNSLAIGAKEQRVGEYKADTLASTPLVSVLDALCAGDSRHDAGITQTYLAFCYRGAYVRRVAGDDAVAEANQVVIFNASEAFEIRHPVAGGDASLLLVIEPQLLSELAPPALVRAGAPFRFNRQRLRIDPRAQALVAMLRHSLREGIADPLEAESLALSLAQRALGPRTSHAGDATLAQRRLVNRVKLALSADLARRWTLGEIAAEVGGSPLYLTQIFRQAEGVPLYRYQLRLRLAKALDLIAGYEDLTALGLDLGFSSHSHFTSAFRAAYGRTPSEFREAVSRDR
jgi:AraC-like DNA-binding protein